MKQLFYLLLFLPAATAVAQPSSPEVSTVTRISDAAEYCGLTKARINWQEIAADRIKILVPNAEALPALSSEKSLTSCFFPWAYERKVTVEFSLAESVKK